MVLLSMLLLLIGVYAVHTTRVWYLERQLHALAHGLIDTQWTEEVSGSQPLCDVSIRTTCTFSQIVVGEKAGKIGLIFVPRPHNPSRVIFEVSYYYEDHGEGWAQVGSFGHGIGRVR